MPQIIVKVNAGGTRYEVSLTTLTREPSSMLGRMFADWPTSLVSETFRQDEVFLDVDGPTFKHVLNYLRYGPEFVLPSRSEELLQELKTVAQYLQLEGLLHLIDQRSESRNIPVDVSSVTPILVEVGSSVRFNADGLRVLAQSFALRTGITGVGTEEITYVLGIIMAEVATATKSNKSESHRPSGPWIRCPLCLIDGGRRIYSKYCCDADQILCSARAIMKGLTFIVSDTASDDRCLCLVVHPDCQKLMPRGHHAGTVYHVTRAFCEAVPLDQND